jgi:hypothetical protein
MRTLYVSQYYPPETAASAVRIVDILLTNGNPIAPVRGTGRVRLPRKSYSSFSTIDLNFV